MQPDRQFDYDEFVRGFHAACARRGIDPQEGATSYEVVLVLADEAEARRVYDQWWLRHQLWWECEPYHSEVEEEVIWNLFLQSYLPVMSRLAMLVALRNAKVSLQDLYRNTEEREVER